MIPKKYKCVYVIVFPAMRSVEIFWPLLFRWLPSVGGGGGKKQTFTIHEDDQIVKITGNTGNI